MSDTIERTFRCTGCGEARPCTLTTTQTKAEIAFFDPAEHLECVLDKSNKTAHNWKEVQANGDDKSTEPSINYDGLLGTGLTAKDIEGISFGVGDTVSFNTYTPDKMNTIRKVRIRNNELWAGEIPIAMLTEERRNLKVIK